MNDKNDITILSEKMSKVERWFLVVLLICFVDFTITTLLSGKNIASETDSSVNDEVSKTEYNVYFNQEEQTFRTDDGHKLGIIEYNGSLYMPIQEKGLFFDYDIVVDNEEQNIYVSEYEKPYILSFDTYTIKGDRFTSENLYNYDYTIFLNWDVWCPDCMILLDKLAESIDKLNELNIQIIGIPYINSDDNLYELSKEIDEIFVEKGISFENIVPTKDIENLIQTNLSNIPTIILADNKGRLLTKVEDVEINIQDLLINIHTFDICGDC